jgi:hypothetical protein
MVVAMLVTTGAVLAQDVIQALPGGGWLTGQQIQNVGTGPANMAATAYGKTSGAYDATGVTGGLDAVPAGESRNILPQHWSNAPDSFEGSAVVSADQPIVAIVNVAKDGDAAAAQYQGVGTPDTSIGFPLFKKAFGPKETTFYVQNAGSSAAMIYATFTDDAGTKYTWDSGTAVDPNRMVVLSPRDASPAMADRTKGGLVVTSTVPIAGAVLEHGLTDVTILQATRGFSPADYDTTLVAPVFKQQFGKTPRSTGLQVQNVSDADVDVYVTYIQVGTGTQYVQKKMGVAPGASYTFFDNASDMSAGSDTIPAGVLASATVTATGNIAAIINETYWPAPDPAVQNNTQTTYSAMAAKNATMKIGIPLAKELMGASLAVAKSTGIQVMNVGDVTATVQLAYSFPSGTFTIIDEEIGAGASKTYFQVSNSTTLVWQGDNQLPGGAGQFGGVIVTADKPVVALANEADLNATLLARQDTKVYEGFNLPDTP